MCKLAKCAKLYVLDNRDTFIGPLLPSEALPNTSRKKLEHKNTTTAIRLKGIRKVKVSDHGKS